MLNANTIKTFDLHDFLKQGEVFHYSKVTLFDADDICYHKHNYYEIFWIENGTGEQHINNAKVNLFSGIISFIKKDDIHYFKPKDKVNGLTIHNIAFFEADFIRYKAQYPALIEKYFDNQVSFTLTRDKLSRLLNFIQYHQDKPRDTFHLDLLILWIFSLLEEVEKRDEGNEPPGWLKYAIDTFVKPASIGFSLEQFVQLTARSTDHVNRVIKVYYQTTLTQFLINKKLEYAASQLIMTNISIKKVASHCGWNNISYFYKIFKEKYHYTPMVYREMNQNPY